MCPQQRASLPGVLAHRYVWGVVPAALMGITCCLRGCASPSASKRDKSSSAKWEEACGSLSFARAPRNLGARGCAPDGYILLCPSRMLRGARVPRKEVSNIAEKPAPVLSRKQTSLPYFYSTEWQFDHVPAAVQSTSMDGTCCFPDWTIPITAKEVSSCVLLSKNQRLTGANKVFAVMGAQGLVLSGCALLPMAGRIPWKLHPAKQESRPSALGIAGCPMPAIDGSRNIVSTASLQSPQWATPSCILA